MKKGAYNEAPRDIASQAQCGYGQYCRIGSFSYSCIKLLCLLHTFPFLGRMLFQVPFHGFFLLVSIQHLHSGR